MYIHAFRTEEEADKYCENGWYLSSLEGVRTCLLEKNTKHIHTWWEGDREGDRSPLNKSKNFAAKNFNGKKYFSAGHELVDAGAFTTSSPKILYHRSKDCRSANLACRGSLDHSFLVLVNTFNKIVVKFYLSHIVFNKGVYQLSCMGSTFWRLKHIVRAPLR